MDEGLVPPIQMQIENLVPICVKALKHARAENRTMLTEVLRFSLEGQNACWRLPDGFTSQAFDRLAYDTAAEAPRLSADLKAIADWRRPLDGERALVENAVYDGMVMEYEQVKYLLGKADWRNAVLGGKWRLLAMSDRAAYAVVPA